MNELRVERGKNNVRHCRETSRARRARKDACGGAENKKRRGFFPRRNCAPLELHVVVKEELVRMRAQADGVVLFALTADPHVQKVCGEDVTLKQERIILFQVIERFLEATGHLGNLGMLLRR